MEREITVVEAHEICKDGIKYALFEPVRDFIHTIIIHVLKIFY